MKELLMKEGNSIACFKKGDIITRVESGILKRENLNDNLGVMVETEIKDNSYMGEPFKLIGIFNNQIWLQPLSSFKLMVFGNKPTRLNLDSWSEGWAIFELPEGYTIEDL